MNKLRCVAAGSVAVLLLGMVLAGAIRSPDRDDFARQMELGTEEGFRRASELSPVISAPFMGLGLLAESDGRREDARRFLTRAVELDRTYQPRWTLANFYLRHDDPRAWPLLAEALRIAMAGRQDAAPLFEACWQFRADPDFLVRQVVGSSPHALKLYIEFLMNAHREGGLEAPSMLLAAASTGANRELLQRASDLLLAAGDVAAAKRIWDMTSPAASKGELLTNTGFHEPRQLGFDWRYNSLPESRIQFGGGAKFELNGKQPDPLELIFQQVLVPGGSYSLSWESKQTPTELPAGMFWQATDARTGAELFRSPFAAAGDWVMTAESLVIADTRLIRLGLHIQRATGSQRFAGVVWLRNPRLRAQ